MNNKTSLKLTVAKIVDDNYDCKQDSVEKTCLYILDGLLNGGEHHKQQSLKKALQALVGDNGVSKILESLKEETYIWNECQEF